jgi:hypothetical protein
MTIIYNTGSVIGTHSQTQVSQKNIIKAYANSGMRYAPNCMPLLWAAFKVLHSGMQTFQNNACCQCYLLHACNIACCMQHAMHHIYIF